MAGVDMALVKQTQEDVASRANNDTTYFKFENDGIYQIRLLPPFGDRDRMWKEYQKCFNIGPNKKIAVPLSQFGQECPIQKRIDALNKVGDEISKKEAGKLRPRSRVAMIVIDRKNEAKGPMLFETNLEVFRDILTIMADPDFGDITRPAEGIDIQITYTKSGKTGFPDYVVQPKRNSTPLSTNPQQQANWLAKDWMEEYFVGKPSDAGYLQACLDGTEAAWNEQRKRDRDAGVSQPSQQTQQTYQAPPTQPSAPAGPAVEPVVTHRHLAGTKLWRHTSAGVVPTTVEDVCQALKTEKPESVNLMSFDQSSGWQNATAMGFVVTIPAPPPAPIAPPPPSAPPAAPPGPPAMPPPPPGGADEIPFDKGVSLQTEEEALKQQLAAYTQSGPQSVVAQDIMRALGKG